MVEHNVFTLNDTVSLLRVMLPSRLQPVEPPIIGEPERLKLLTHAWQDGLYLLGLTPEDVAHIDDLTFKETDIMNHGCLQRRLLLTNGYENMRERIVTGVQRRPRTVSLTRCINPLRFNLSIRYVQEQERDEDVMMRQNFVVGPLRVR